MLKAPARENSEPMRAQRSQANSRAARLYPDALSGRFAGRGEILQRSIGNQAMLRLLTAQRMTSLIENAPPGHDAKEAVPANRVARGATPTVSAPASEIPRSVPTAWARRVETSSPITVLSQPAVMQPKLLVGKVDDPLEQDADAQAERVMRMPDPGSRLATSPPRVSRKCAACEKDEKLQTKPAGPRRSVDTAPSIVHEVLRSSGHTLDSTARAFMEQRFGYDFSRVNVHTDTRAVASSLAMNATAYAVGHHLVFGKDLYQPGTMDGRRLIAHELAHVIQQNAAMPLVGSAGPERQQLEGPGVIAQRQTESTPDSDKIQNAAIQGGEGQAGEPTSVAEPASGSAPGVEIAPGVASTTAKPETCPAPSDIACPATKATVDGVTNTLVFAVGSAVLGDAIPSSTAWASATAEVDAVARSWNDRGAQRNIRVDGYASAEYDCAYNWRLSCLRAQAVAAELESPNDHSAGVPPSYIALFAHGESNEAGAKLGPNRRVTLSVPVVPPGPTPTPEPSPTPTPENKCGPDITAALSAVLSSVDPYFSGLSSWKKRRSCMALDIDSPIALVNPIMAWDTRDLFLPNTSWLDSDFRSRGCGSPRDPGCDTDDTRSLCETAGTCGNSVVVDGKCMLAGTANYALYGKLFRLCNDEFSPDYPRWDMKAMIWLYKVIPDDPGPPLAMATAAFDGAFPTVPAVAESRAGCTGRCGVIHGGSFDFIWEPYKSR